MLLNIPPIHQFFIGMLGVLALPYSLQIPVVFFCRLRDMIHAFLAITFKENGVWISRQESLISAKFIISTLEVL